MRVLYGDEVPGTGHRGCGCLGKSSSPKALSSNRRLTENASDGDARDMGVERDEAGRVTFSTIKMDGKGRGLAGGGEGAGEKKAQAHELLTGEMKGSMDCRKWQGHAAEGGRTS